jgi:hypothetical protein
LRGLAATLGGDKTNVTQSLRLPGLINTKPARNGAVCQIIELHPERRYSLSDFKEQIAVKQSQTRSNSPQQISMKGDLNPSLIHAVSDCLLSEYGGFIKPNGYLAAGLIKGARSGLVPCYALTTCVPMGIPLTRPADGCGGRVSASAQGRRTK